MRNKTILIVDDDPDILLTLKLALEKAGYRVETAESIIEVLVKYPPFTPDLVLLDVMMPWMFGDPACVPLKKRFNNCPIIMISARGQQADIERGMRSGADECFTKPFDLEVLLAKISEHITDTFSL